MLVSVKAWSFYRPKLSMLRRLTKQRWWEYLKLGFYCYFWFWCKEEIGSQMPMFNKNVLTLCLKLKITWSTFFVCLFVCKMLWTMHQQGSKQFFLITYDFNLHDSSAILVWEGVQQNYVYVCHRPKNGAIFLKMKIVPGMFFFFFFLWTFNGSSFFFSFWLKLILQ